MIHSNCGIGQLIRLVLAFLLIAICIQPGVGQENSKPTTIGDVERAKLAQQEVRPSNSPASIPAAENALSTERGDNAATDGTATAKNESPAASDPSAVHSGNGVVKETPKNDRTGVAGGPMLRTIVGFEQAGVSAAQSQQDFFLDLYYDRPLAFHVDSDFGPALRSWGNLRVSSVPQQINTSVAQFAAQFAQQVGQLKVNQVAQSFEFLGGVDYRFWSSPETYSSTDTNDSSSMRVSASWILGAGVITPLSPQQSVQVFDIPSNQPLFFLQYPQAKGKQYVAFTLEDRNRFFRQAYGGLRLKTNFVGGSARFPETLDLTYGVNESVTGGTIRGGVIRLEGFVPIPYAKASWIYLFGTGLFKPGGRAVSSSPFFLDPATGILPTNQNAVIIPTPQTDRDYYRVGFGIDFVTLIKSKPWSKK